MKIGLDQFSFHRFYGDVFPWEVDPGRRWGLEEFLTFAREHHINLVGLHTHYLTPSEIEQLGETGLEIILEWGHPDGLKMGTSPASVDDLRRWLGVAARIGCRLVRIVAGYPTWRGREPVATQIKRLTPVLREICVIATGHGLTLAIENHADFSPHELVDLLDRVRHDALRICFDTGNCVRTGANLIEATHLVAGRTAMVHLKDLRVLPSSIGDHNASWPSAPLGQGSFDLPTVITVMRQNSFAGPWLVELAHLHPDFPCERVVLKQSLHWLKEHTEHDTTPLCR